MTDLETILSWFQTGDMPTEEEFRETLSSFRLKNTKIPIEEVDKLESLLNSKINADDYIKDGKIRADKIEPLGLTELIESSEKDISEFVENSDKYEFQQNDFIAVPNEDGTFSLYLFKGGEKKNKSNYLSTGSSNINIGDNFIPLSGTTPENPISGNLILQDNVSLKFKDNQYSSSGLTLEGDSLKLQGGEISGYVNSWISIDPGQIFITGRTDNYEQVTNLLITPEGVTVSTPFQSRGIIGIQDHSPYIQDLDYVQKKYVDTNLANETLATIINRGNYSPKSIGIGSQTDPIYFSNDFNTFNIGITETDYLNKSGVTGSVNMAIGYSALKNITSGSYNLAIGPFSGKDITTGYGNTLYGQGTGSVITSGSYNTAIGYNAGTKITTPQWNTFVGYGNNEATTIGFKNTSLGTYANASGAGNLNTVIGYKAANTKPIGDRNIIIGASAAQGATGSNNILIGIGAGQSDGAISNKLIIHSNHTLTGYSNTAEGNFGSFQQSTLSRALITGDFVERWARINGYFVVGNPASESNNIIINPSTGITAAQFYTPSTDNSFVQKKYVDEKTEFIKYNSSNESLTSYTKRKLNALEGESAYMHILGQFNISANSFTTLIFTSNNVAVGIKKIIGKTNTGDYVDLIVESIADGTTRIINPSDNDYTDLVINSYLLGEATNMAK